MIPKNLDELNQLYQDAESTDKELYAEMRSNLLLVAGEHYTKNVNKHFARLRETNRLTETLKLRLTKNLTYRVASTYSRHIYDKAPDVKCLPNNESEMQDQKDAKLNNLVLDNVKRKHKMREKIRTWVDEFVDIGEVATKVFWDPNKGDLVGYNQAQDEMGNPLFQRADGTPTPNAVEMDPLQGIEIQNEMLADKDSPVFSGDFVFESIHGFNLWRAPGCKSIEESPYLGLRKMTSMDELRAMYKDQPEKLAKIEKSAETDYIVFDSGKSQYEKSENWTLVKECYWRPCKQYPEGYFQIWTDYGILEQGTLPNGIFPIRWKGFDVYATAPRGRSVIKVARPYQAELNRAASQRATHQITLGDDKVLYQSGTKLAPGGLLPGVRGVTYQGQTPTIIPGRTGEQYAGYIKDEKQELFEATSLDQINQDEQQNLDPYTLLFRTLGQQAKYKKYVEKFEEFLVDVFELVLELAKFYLPDEELAQMVGPNERVNILEFRKTSKLRYQIKLAPQSDSIDSQLGKQLTFNHLLQYIGKNLKPEQIGQIMRNMPFVNNEEIFNDLTIDYDNVKNDMLALERGEQVQVSPYSNSEYYVQKLTHRMKQADFRFLPPEVQQQYQLLVQQHQQKIVQEQQAVIDAKNEYIPVGGAMVAIDMYVPDEDPSKQPKRARVPYQAVDWLLKMLEKQGMSLEKLENMNQGAVAEMASMFTQGQPPASNPMMMQ